MLKKIVAANWKMNLDAHEGSALIHEIERAIPNLNQTRIIVFPSSVSLHPLAKEVDPRKIQLGVQNIHYNDHGPFTGEISPHMVQGVVDYALIGHSERRHIFGETDEDVAKKVQAAVNHKLKPLICVGETLQERTNQETNSVVRHQIDMAISLLSKIPQDGLVIAYEPVWAISDGTDFATRETPSARDLEPIIDVVENAINDHFGAGATDSVKILYGASVNPGNAADLLAADGCDGLFVGGASLKAESFTSIINTVDKS